MSEPIIVVDSSEVHEARLNELKTAIKEMVAFVEANEPRPVIYNVYLNEDDARMTVVQVHPDSASMELHLQLAGPVFRKFVELITLTAIDIYGQPSVGLLEQTRRKVQLLGNATIAIHQLHAGFARLGEPMSVGARKSIGT